MPFLEIDYLDRFNEKKVWKIIPQEIKFIYVDNLKSEHYVLSALSEDKEIKHYLLKNILGFKELK